MKFADVIKQELYGSDSSYAEVAHLLDIKPSTVRGWCCGQIVPTVEHCLDLDEVFDKPYGYFERIKRLDGDAYEREEYYNERKIYAAI